MKELVETGDIGTVGTQQHPFTENAINIISSKGLADVYLTNDVNYYQPDTDTWGDTVSDYRGLGLLQTKTFAAEPTGLSAITAGKIYQIATVVATDWTSLGGDSTAAVGEEFKATTTNADISALGTVNDIRKVTQPVAQDWFSYTRRNGYFDYFTNKSFGDAFDTLTSPVTLDSLVDPSWQSAADEDSEVAKDYINEMKYVSATNTWEITASATCTNWNRLYQGIQHQFNHSFPSLNSGSNAVPDATLKGALRRLIKRGNTVADGLINIEDYNVKLIINSDIGLSTGTGTLGGINLNSNTLTLEAAANRNIEGIVKSNTLDIEGEEIDFVDSDIAVTTALTLDGSLNNTKVVGGGAVTVDEAISNGCNITSGGAFRAKSTVADSVINSGNKVDIDEVVSNLTITATDDVNLVKTSSNTIINASADKTVTLTGIATAVTVNGSADIRPGNNTINSVFGSTGSRAKSVIWSDNSYFY